MWESHGSGCKRKIIKQAVGSLKKTNLGSNLEQMLGPILIVTYTVA